MDLVWAPEMMAFENRSGVDVQSITLGNLGNPSFAGRAEQIQQT
jgi:hypothetical protein